MKIHAMVADGTEECELLNVVDILRRVGLETHIVSVDGRTVKSSHGVSITADCVADDVDIADCDLLFIPGGMPGSVRLGGYAPLISAVERVLDKGGRVAAICAAPGVVLGENGFLVGKKATCFPGFEGKLKGATKVDARVVTDGAVTTARGLGCAIDLGLEIVKLLIGKEKAEEVKSKIQY